eukprot:TRINITY_DN6465_c0_g1_i1.p1 TRINITY_DN6465_c0_g1~~TRINITY_DN6465_c0_g1_i1.p1  ORF type:complete len:434 (+),score=68.27 TRINITY_DN6465_c0_g1_i1:45-1346(+)
MKRSAIVLFAASLALGQERLTEERIEQRIDPFPSLTQVEGTPLTSQRSPLLEYFELEKVPSSSCCQPKIPPCCTLGTGNLWVGNSGDLATQPTTFNDQCLNSVDFGMSPALTGGQPFCHSIDMPGAATTTSAALYITMTSNPPCGVTSDRFCLITADGNEWCTLLQPGTNSFCLHLEDLGLLSAGMSPLLIRAAYHTTVNSMRFHVNMCLPPAPSIPTPSIEHDFTNNLVSSTGSPTMTWVSGTAAWFVGGPEGTSANFQLPASYLSAPNDVSQQGGTAMSMAIWLYFDSEVNLAYQGLPIVTKYGSYRWMFNPGQQWNYHHVHLGPGFGDLVHANPAYVGSDYRIPIKKWLCMAVTINVDATAGTTTLHYYQNGKLWAPPTVRNTLYNMDGTSDLYINADNSQFWPGKVDKFSLWKQVLTSQDVSEYCNCPP